MCPPPAHRTRDPQHHCPYCARHPRGIRSTASDARGVRSAGPTAPPPRCRAPRLPTAEPVHTVVALPPSPSGPCDPCDHESAFCCRELAHSGPCPGAAPHGAHAVTTAFVSQGPRVVAGIPHCVLTHVPCAREACTPAFTAVTSQRPKGEAAQTPEAGTSRSRPPACIGGALPAAQKSTARRRSFCSIHVCLAQRPEGRKSPWGWCPQSPPRLHRALEISLICFPPSI